MNKNIANYLDSEPTSVIIYLDKTHIINQLFFRGRKMRWLILLLLTIFCFTECSFAIQREKLYRDDIKIMYPGKEQNSKSLSQKKSNFIIRDVENVRKNLKQKRASRASAIPDLPAVVSERVEKFRLSIDTTLKNAIPLANQTVISIPSVISTEFRLESGNTYHATTDVLVTVGGILKHEPGAIVKWAENTGLLVDPNGTYIANGLPNEMCIHIADSNDASIGYWKGIKFQGGNAYSSMSEITFTYVVFAQDAITLSDITLNKACENNFLEFNGKGIVSYGPKQSRISNNIIYWNDYGVHAHQENESGTTADPESVIEIVSNTCHENGYGVMISGTSSELSCVILMERNLSTASTYYNFALATGNLGGYFIPYFIDNGRWLKYAGSENTNYDASSWEYFPVEVFSNPFVQGSSYFDLVRLDPSCAFIDVSQTYITESAQIGFSTRIDNMPDVNQIDLGFHYANWEFFNNTSPADFNGDSVVDLYDLGTITDFWLFNYNDAHETRLRDYDDSNQVDFADLVVILEGWLDPYDFQTFAWFAEEWQNEVDSRLFNSRPDIVPDGVVNFKDFTVFANDWQKTEEGYPQIDMTISDGQYGEKNVAISGYDSSIFTAFIFIDGVYVKQVFLDATSSYSTTELFVPWLDSGEHKIKLIAHNLSGDVICYPIQKFQVNESINECLVPNFFKQGNVIPFSALSSLSGEDVNVTAWCDGQEVWSNTYSGEYINGEIPTSVTQDNDIEYLQFTSAAKSSGNVVVPTSSTADNSSDYTALLVRPDFAINFVTGSAEHVKEQLERRGYKVKKLGFFTSSHKKIKKYNDKHNIQVFAYFGHGGYLIEEDEKLRTTTLLDDGIIISDKVSNYAPGSAPPWLEPLSTTSEAALKTWKEIGFTNLRFVDFRCCYDLLLRINSSDELVKSTANYAWRGDLSMALGLVDYDNYMIGWSDKYPTNSKFSKFSHDIWQKLGDGEFLDQAINYAIDECDPQGGKDPRDEYRINGQGLMSSFRL